jgi:hypothetical protein
MHDARDIGLGASASCRARRDVPSQIRHLCKLSWFALPEEDGATVPETFDDDITDRGARRWKEKKPDGEHVTASLLSLNRFSLGARIVSARCACQAILPRELGS